MIQPIRQLHKTTNNSPKQSEQVYHSINHKYAIMEILDGIEWDLTNVREPEDRIKSKVVRIRYHLERI